MKKILNAQLLKIGEPNLNGRIYPKAVIEEANSKITQPLLGELGFPPAAINELHGAYEKYMHRQLEVSVNNCSRAISNLKIEDGVVFGDVTVLETPKGALLNRLIDLPGASFKPRVIGRIDGDEIKDVTFISFDFTFGPT